MSKAIYQHGYSNIRPQMHDIVSRVQKAKRIVILLGKHLGKQNLKNLNVLDIGSSTGIIDNYLAKYFKSIFGTDIDRDAVNFASKEFSKITNLQFKVADALKLPFKSNTFDVIICTHIYEHVPDPKKLFSEIHRVLKVGGVCYLAAGNSLWPLEPHYNLLFLSYLPKSISNIYVKMFKKADFYYETLCNYWQLKKMLKKFNIVTYTHKILESPKEYGYDTISMPSYLAKILHFFTPTFFWILIKHK